MEIEDKEINDPIFLILKSFKVVFFLITLRRENTHVIKSQAGIGSYKTLWKDIFCRFLKQNVIITATDTLQDVRFINIPIVKMANGIRSYCSIPLVTSNNYHIGNLCIADIHPRRFSRGKIEMLSIISRQIVRMMELQLNLSETVRQNLALKKQKEKTVAVNELDVKIPEVVKHIKNIAIKIK